MKKSDKSFTFNVVVEPKLLPAISDIRFVLRCRYEVTRRVDSVVVEKHPYDLVPGRQHSLGILQPREAGFRGVGCTVYDN